MKAAPIALFVYRRPEHTRRTLEFLRRNVGAGESALHIFCDGPRSEAEKPLTDEVREIAARAEGFASVELHAAERNRGLAASVVAGVDEMTARFGRVIVLEDDMESSPYFLSFMNEALNRFAHDGRIAEIHGYTAPLPPGTPECFLRRGADCWGWATWERGWRLFNPDAAALLTELKRRGETRLFDLDGAFPFCRMLADQAAGKLDSWAIRWQASVFLAGKYMLQSGRPLIRNIGGDGSGRHCAAGVGEEFRLWERPVGIPEEPETEREAVRQAYRASLGNWRIPLSRRIAGKLRYEFRRLFPGGKK